MKSLLCLFALLAACTGAGGQALPETPAARQGFAPARLQRLDDYLAARVARRTDLGTVVLVMRHGRVVAFNAWGYRDLARQEPLRRDAIFRIDALTKAVTAVAVLALLEEGRLGLDDPVATHLPEFAPGAPTMTIRHLLSQTAGFAPPEHVAAARLEEVHDLDRFTRELARLPLASPPGSRFQDDGLCMAVAARLVEVVSGLRFDAFVHKRLFRPLAMADTGFTVPPAQRQRLADIATTGSDGELAPPGLPGVPGHRRHAYLSGADGLYSTATDYARFAQMLLNGGALDGVRVLGRKSVELMMQNHLSHLTNPTWDTGAAQGYGLGGAVLLDVARGGRLGTAGAFGWTGTLATRFIVDPREKLVVVVMRQHALPASARQAAADLDDMVYQALVD